MPARKRPPRPGEGRPRIYPRGHVSRTLSLDVRADEAVAAHAAKLGSSRSQAASALILIGDFYERLAAEKVATAAAAAARTLPSSCSDLPSS